MEGKEIRAPRSARSPTCFPPLSPPVSASSSSWPRNGVSERTTLCGVPSMANALDRSMDRGVRCNASPIRPEGGKVAKAMSE